MNQPARFLELAPPFVLAALSPADDRLELFTDSIGVGRLFQLRLPDGWVWSNRPAAALLFAGHPARPAARGWRYAAACGWFMDDSTPYDGVLAVPGATRIIADGRRRRRTVSRIDVASVWSGTDGLSPELMDDAAEALQAVAKTVGRLWPTRPTVDLSGGRDSRVVSAAFLSAGVDLRLNSYDAVPGEVDVAERLVATLKRPVEHTVTRRTAPVTDRAARVPAEPPAMPPLLDRALRWHRYAEGLRPASYLFHAPPSSLRHVSHLAIGGAGGEVAHGHYYPADVIQLDALHLDAKLEQFITRLQSRLVLASGPAEQARGAVADQIERVLWEAVRSGIEDAAMLDYFYLVERLRRWGTTGERSGVVSPLLVPAFVRGAFSLTPRQRLENTLHNELVRRLVPEWDAIPFFKPSMIGQARRRAARVRTVASAPDRDRIRELVTGAPPDGFDPAKVTRLWTSSAAGTSSAVEEAALCQLLWQASFEDHLVEINRHLDVQSIPVRAASATRARNRQARPSGRIARNGVVRALARQPAWQAFRRTKIGRSWRSLSGSRGS
jgi:hypothetical protein